MTDETIVHTGFASTEELDAYARALHFRRRLAVLMRGYGAWMVRAERCFNGYANSFGADQETAFAGYVHASNRAARMSARHAALARRIIRSL